MTISKMLPTSCHVSILQAVCIALSMRGTTAVDQVRQPFGPIMCRDHCRQFTGCTFCVFLVTRLVCMATCSHNLETHGEEIAHLDMNKDGDGAYLPRRMQCPDLYSRVLRTRTSNHRCIKLRRKKMTRLLLAPISKKEKKPFILMHLVNSSTEQHPYLQASDVTDIAYVPSTHRVLVAIKTVMYIQSCALTKNDCVIVRHRIRARCMVVDDALNLAFLAVTLPYASLARMNPDGRYFEYIVRNFGFPYSLCVDTSQRKLYVRLSKNITVFSYNGAVKEVRRIFVNSYTLALDENVLYAGLLRSVKYMHLPLSTGSVSTITHITHTPHDIQHYGEKLYISYTSLGPNKIAVFYRNRMSIRQMKGDRRQGYVMTLIT